MPPDLELFLQAILEALTLFVLLVGLLGLIVPVSAGILLWNFGGGTGPAIEGYWTYDE